MRAMLSVLLSSGFRTRDWRNAEPFSSDGDSTIAGAASHVRVPSRLERTCSTAEMMISYGGWARPMSLPRSQNGGVDMVGGIEERRHRTRELIDHLLEERQQMWVLYARLAGVEP